MDLTLNAMIGYLSVLIGICVVIFFGMQIYIALKKQFKELNNNGDKKEDETNKQE